MVGVDAVLIAVGASPDATPEVAKAVEVGGVQNTATALYRAGGTQAVLCSSMGTTSPDPDPAEGGSILFWKLNAEASLLAADLRVAVVKPCGLGTNEGGQRNLTVGQDDTLLDDLRVPIVPRADVARVMIETLFHGAPKLRFDLCATLTGAPTTDLSALLDEARYPTR